MEIELLPAVSLLPETLNVLIAPEEMLARALNGNPHLQQFRLVSPGIRSGVLGRLDCSSMDLVVRGAFTSVQLRKILEENLSNKGRRRRSLYFKADNCSHE